MEGFNQKDIRKDKNTITPQAAVSPNERSRNDSYFRLVAARR